MLQGYTSSRHHATVLDQSRKSASAATPRQSSSRRGFQLFLAHRGSHAATFTMSIPLHLTLLQCFPVYSIIPSKGWSLVPHSVSHKTSPSLPQWTLHFSHHVTPTGHHRLMMRSPRSGHASSTSRAICKFFFQRLPFPYLKGTLSNSPERVVSTSPLFARIKHDFPQYTPRVIR